MSDPSSSAPQGEYVVSVTKHRSGGEWVLRKWSDAGWMECSRNDPADSIAFDLADVHDWFDLPTGDYPIEVPRGS